MTEFRGIRSGKTITTKNNMNNVMVGNRVEINEDNGKTMIIGIVTSVEHIVSKWHNKECLERSTHDLIINVKD